MNLTSNIYFNNRRPTAMDRIIHSARLLSLTKTKKWLHKFIDLGKVMVETEGIVSSVERKTVLKSFIDVMVDGFTSRYGDDWDVHIERGGAGKYKLQFFTVFSSIEITNEREESHTIKDLIVCIPIDYSPVRETFYLARIRGGRITLSKKEFQAEYAHSHLRGYVATEMVNTPFYLDKFCIGAGDLSLLQEVMSADFTVRNLQIFLYELDATVRWESLSGTPYMYMRNIVSNRKRRASVQNSDASYVTEILLRNAIPVNYYISANRYRIKLDETFNNFVKNLVETDSELETIKERVICVFDKVAKTYYAYGSVVVSGEDMVLRMYNQEKAYLIYNGQKKFAAIKKDTFINSSEITTDTPIIHPKFLENVHTALENSLHEKVTRFSGISKYHSAEYQPSNITQNSVSL